MFHLTGSHSDIGLDTLESGQMLSPTQKYCRNLGHKYDATSGLVYMRARYYEAETGRFICEDPGMAGGDWCVHCENTPTNFADAQGTNAVSGHCFINIGR